MEAAGTAGRKKYQHYPVWTPDEKQPGLFAMMFAFCCTYCLFFIHTVISLLALPSLFRFEMYSINTKYLQKEYRAVSGVFQNIDPPPPLHPASVSFPPHQRRGGGGGGTECTLGGFNVSNLMGIKRRMIDIGKKITFYFLQNVWKCTVFFAFAFKVCKKCNYDPKKFFLAKYQYGYKKTQNFMLISNSLMPT